MTLKAALHLLTSLNASVRYLPRLRAWRVLRVREDGRMALGVYGSLAEAVGSLSPHYPHS